MSFSRVKGMLTQELFITVRSFEVILDIIVFPAMSVIVFGFMAIYLSGKTNAAIADSLLIGMLFWQIVFIVQYSVSVGSLWNIWSRNLSNVFITPISLLEYMFSQSISGIVKALCVFGASAIFAVIFFHFNVFTIGLLNMSMYFINLMFFALSLGIIILGLIFRFGTRIQAFAWGLLPIFQPLCATFYPVSVLPEPLQKLAWLLPPTYIFEAMRANLIDPTVMQWNLISLSFGENILYFLVAVIFFNIMFNQSKKTGQFAKLEG